MVLRAFKYLVSGVESAARLVVVLLAIIHAVRLLSPVSVLVAECHHSGVDSLLAIIDPERGT